MPKLTAENIAGSASWWLEEGDEECVHCGCSYIYEVEFRCTECDAAGCPHCKIIHAQGHFICPDCATVDSQKSRQVRRG